MYLNEAFVYRYFIETIVSLKKIIIEQGIYEINQVTLLNRLAKGHVSF